MCEWLSFSTLTYPAEFPVDGRVCKRHLNLLLTHLRKHYPGVKYVWFLEFQERGAPHFHIFTTCPVPGRTYLSPLWYHIVNSEDKKHLVSGTQVRALKSSSEAIKYATSYANKLKQKTVPERSKSRVLGLQPEKTDPIVELEVTFQIMASVSFSTYGQTI